jgi:hypothetical protein
MRGGAVNAKTVQFAEMTIQIHIMKSCDGLLNLRTDFLRRKEEPLLQQSAVQQMRL